MAKLPESLVKEFVRMTNDTSKKKSESFLYGTVDNVNEDGTIDVIFDGADSSTPCTSSVSVAAGDRVLAMLKNRQAVITANITSPSINTEKLEASVIKARDKYQINLLYNGQPETIDLVGVQLDEDYEGLGLILVYGGDVLLHEQIFDSDVRVTGHFSVDGSSFIKGSLELGDPTQGFQDIHIFPATQSSEGAIHAPHFYGQLHNPSDRSLKHYIADTKENDALGKVNQIRHRQYVWNKTNEPETLGYIAQELKDIDPGLASEHDGLYSINNLHLIALATKAIQELSAKVDSLERRVEELESKCNQKLSD